ncbi:MAG: GAF domain-containing protein [Bdellovibrionales bacterium]|nr:GAF domain-containing protein [Bdellovibrionales bacterium]
MSQRSHLSQDLDLPLDSGGLEVMSARAGFLETTLDLLTRDVSFEEFVRELLSVIVAASRSEAGSVLEINYKEESVFFRTALGYGAEQVVRFVIPLGQGIVGHVVESRLPFHMSHAEENKRHLASISHAVGFVVRNMIAVPLIIRGKVFGVVELLNRIAEDDYCQQDLDEVNQFCKYAAKAIELRLMMSWAASRTRKNEEAA